MVFACWLHKHPILGGLLSGEVQAEVYATDRRYVSGTVCMLVLMAQQKCRSSLLRAARTHRRRATQTPCQTPYSPQEAPLDSYRLSSILHWVGLIVVCRSTYILLSLSVASALTLFSHSIATPSTKPINIYRRRSYNHNHLQSSA